MLSKILFGRPRRAEPKAALPDGERFYAIGDIHGRLDLLDTLLDKIADDDTARGGSATLVFLGDLIDRGPESAQVVERLLRLERARAEGATRFLLGNHEEVFLSAISGDEKALRLFTKIGGRETILSYGIAASAYDALDYPELLCTLQAAVPEAHIMFLGSFEDLIIAGDYAFVHAGIRPGVPLAQQRSRDLRWIRSEFLQAKGMFDRVIVHGHTITEEVELLPNRIGLDTGAFASGKLTAMGFQGDKRWLLQT